MIGKYPQTAIMLSIQYRMNETINNWSSNEMYEGKLIADKSVADQNLMEKKQKAIGQSKYDSSNGNNIIILHDFVSIAELAVTFRKLICAISVPTACARDYNLTLKIMKEDAKDVDISFKYHTSEEKEKETQNDQTPTPILNENPFFNAKVEDPPEPQKLEVSAPVMLAPPDIGLRRKKIESSPNFMLNKKRIGKVSAGPLNLLSTKSNENSSHITEIGTVNLNMIINNSSRSPIKQNVNCDSMPQAKQLLDVKSTLSNKGKCCSLEQEHGSICKCVIF